jgi:hypothetical protein
MSRPKTDPQGLSHLALRNFRIGLNETQGAQTRILSQQFSSLRHRLLEAPQLPHGISNELNRQVGLSAKGLKSVIAFNFERYIS